MNKSLRRRVAAVATTATVGGLLLPFLAAGSALAATEPTGLTASPVSQTVAVSAPATITATLTGGTSPAHEVYYRVTAGPNKTTGNTGQVCNFVTTTTYDCQVTSAFAGTDTFQIFYDAAGNGFGGTANFQVGDPAATASVTFAGRATKATITPATAKTATSSTASYTVKGTDANGNPASGSVDVSISQTIPTGADPLNFTSPSDTSFPAGPGGSGTAPAAPVLAKTSAPSGTSNTTYTDTETFSFVGGAATIGVASSAAGSVAISAGTNSITFSAGAASLAVSQGNTSSTPSTSNDNRASGVTQAGNTTSFISRLVSNQATVTNAAGDPLGGVSLVGDVKAGPNTGKAVTPGAVTDQLGHATLSYTAGPTPGTDTLQAFVNQSTGANTINADPTEPQSTTAINLVDQPVGLTISSSQDAGTPIPTTQPSTPVTYTIKDGAHKAAAGLTINFAVDAGSTPAMKAYTLAPKSAVTDANGQVTVTATNPAPAAMDTIIIDASLAGDPAISDNLVTLTYEAAAAALLSIDPQSQTLAAGSSVSETVTVTDQFGKPVTGEGVSFTVAGRNGPVTNTQASGTITTDANGRATFTYTDTGATVTTANQSTANDTVSASLNGTTPVNAVVEFVPGAAKTTTLAITPPSATEGTTANPTAGATPHLTTITAEPVENFGNHDYPLYNKAVTFTSTGVGSFTDSMGNPTGNTATANADSRGFATVYVRSAATGIQNVTASSDGVTSSASKITYTNDYVAVAPSRVLDTRTGQGGTFGNFGGLAPAGPLAADTSYGFNYAATQMPLHAAAYVFNVTAISPSGVGNFRAQPGFNGFGNGSGVPTTSVVNYQPGKDVANALVVANDGSDLLQLYSAGSSANVAIDLVGYYPQANTQTINTFTPARVADTRDTSAPVAAGETRSFQVSGNGGVPSTGMKAVAVNVTAINPKGLGNLRIFAHGDALPTTSNINFIPGQDKAATVIVNLPANGKIDVYSDGSPVDVAIDAYASYSQATSNLVTQTPVRILDTRSGSPLPVTHYIDLQVTGKAGVPADAQAVLVSVTGIHTTGSTGVGNLRVYPSGTALPNVSTLNYVSPTTDVANFAIVPIGANGKISIDSEGSPTDVAVDVLGYVPAG